MSAATYHLYELVVDLEERVDAASAEQQWPLDKHYGDQYVQLLVAARTLFPRDPLILILREQPDTVVMSFLPSKPSVGIRWVKDCTHRLRVRLEQLIEPEPPPDAVAPLKKPPMGFRPPPKGKADDRPCP